MELNNGDRISIEKSTSINMEEMDLLLLADPSEQQIDAYVQKRVTYGAKREEGGVGVL
nr:GNAT family N-acetyltransferase [Bacillus pacificus]